MSATRVEMTVRFATRVNTVAEAWSFVTAHLDAVDDDPIVHIEPVWELHEEDGEVGERFFEVVVEGTSVVPEWSVLSVTEDDNDD